MRYTNKSSKYTCERSVFGAMEKIWLVL